DVPPVLLGVLAVIAFAARQAEDPLLQERVAAVPERQRETQALLEVADACEAVLAPAVGPRARVLVREVLPGAAIRAVVLAHRAPGPLGEIGAECLPVPGPARRRFREARVLRAARPVRMARLGHGEGLARRPLHTKPIGPLTAARAS